MDKPKLNPDDSIYYQRLTSHNAYHLSRHRLTSQGAVFFRLGNILYVEFIGSYTIYLN